MKLASVLLARSIAWVESAEINPRGKVFYPDLVKAIVSRYGFMVYPEKAEDFDESKGVVFKAGKSGDAVIEQLSVFTNGIVVDTRNNTDQAKTLLSDALTWLAKEHDLVVPKIRQWTYQSQLIFYSEAHLPVDNSALRNLARGVSTAVQEITGESLEYVPTGIVLNFDLLKRKNPLGMFILQRRDNAPFEENKFFSDAPLPTDVHLKLLEQYEADLLRG